jgi:uncharacterized protein
MLTDLAATAIHLLIVLPLILMTTRPTANRWRLLVLFAVFVMLNKLLLVLPWHLEAFRFIVGNWNWNGKLLAIAGSLGFYFLFRTDLQPNDFLKVTQRPQTLSTSLLLTIGLAVLSSLVTYFTSDAFGSKWQCRQ